MTDTMARVRPGIFLSDVGIWLTYATQPWRNRTLFISKLYAETVP